MRKMSCFSESKQFRDLNEKCGNHPEFLRVFLKNKESLESKIRQLRFCQLLCDLIRANPTHGNFDELVVQYKNERSMVKKIAMRFGSERQVQYSNRLSENAKNIHATVDIVNWNHVAYHTSRGHTEEEAKQIIGELQSRNSKLGHETRRNTGYSYRHKNPICIEYWLDRSDDPIGSLEEYKRTNAMSKDNYKKRHGEVEGIIRFNEAQTKRKATRLKKYGVFGITTQSSRPGRKVCLKLYKRFRKLGFLRTEMNCQLGNLREFARTDFEFERSYFYDFCLRPLKIIVEYNGLYYHPRDPQTWRRKDLSFEDALAKDERKMSFIENLGYKTFIIWEDDDIETKLSEIIDYAKTIMAE